MYKVLYEFIMQDNFTTTVKLPDYNFESMFLIKKITAPLDIQFT